MSYTRYHESGHYIWGGEDFVDFDCVAVPDDEVDVFLYKLYTLRGGDNGEFWERYHHGKRVIGNFLNGFIVQKLCRHGCEESEPDFAAVAALAAEIWREHYTPIIGAAQVEYMLEKFQSAEQIGEDISRRKYAYFTVREKKHDTLIGYCAVVPQDGYALLSKLYTHKDYRGRGVARSFLEEVFALCRFSYGLDKVRLTVNKGNADSIAVYQKMGFEIVESVKSDIGGRFFMDDYVMELTVPPIAQEEAAHG